jgi:hypothetical protein
MGCIKHQMPITLERIPEEKQILAKILFDNGHSISQVSKRVEISKMSCIAIRHNNSYSPTLVEDYKRRLPMKAYRLADNVIDFISLDEIKKSPLGTKMMAFGVAIDKARDMEGSNRPVFNIVNVVNECQRTSEKLNAQLSAIQARRIALSTETA